MKFSAEISALVVEFELNMHRALGFVYSLYTHTHTPLCVSIFREIHIIITRIEKLSIYLKNSKSRVILCFNQRRAEVPAILFSPKA